ncbi:UDP-GlcNAc--UDP-phosphate GlcNAc-1-phosphate transferase [Pedobacter punctiformis]|uniref:UDP-GlcNAc--UDP-phosphate GlcNAc-1-phosphate transferase n=1 Tax=Pedobacter punctiformis TaxID=3004097 RepID=A0ABT4L4R5_9SPHI|nr:UDP-GlcNAc--UDP-phosphate GlcNAc-1-phosphate transferase [Pedobacter sp. HCMS5-2]MCZ4242904.1 UDP-GlcNAc--UDP-phosphate GlcNAc-1-phosphate transferase [Pedobacter sp. HCMS5-2]
MFDFEYPYFIIGLFLISGISFIDDIITLNNKIRLSIHLLAVALMFYQWNLFDFNWYWLIIAAIFVIGTINAYNFMDGINGITGAYSLVTIITLFYLNTLYAFTNQNLIILTGLSLLVFNFFNFREKAKCFAGDVGSVSIAFILIFLIGQLVLKTQNFSYILLFLLYGLDTVFTIFFRVIRKENIFEAHRSHFYQYLSNELKWPHLRVSTLYFALQLLINLCLIFWTKDSPLLNLILIFICGLLFLLTRFKLEGKKHLLNLE